MLKSNIIIAGVPRAGKSTISRMLSGKFGYQHISMDSINHGFEKVFPELGINTYADMSSLDILRANFRHFSYIFFPVDLGGGSSSLR